ncbi:MAG: hypothetical protein AAGB24_13225 [Bacteroidota bacterium]
MITNHVAMGTKIDFRWIIRPIVMERWHTNVLIAIPRPLGGLLLCFEFGSSKFGMPWSTSQELGLFQVGRLVS